MPIQPRSYRPKVDTIQAVQWDGTEDSAYDIIDWVDQQTLPEGDAVLDSYDNTIAVRNPGNTTCARAGDFIVRDKHAFYACKADTFTAGYEEVSR